MRMSINLAAMNTCKWADHHYSSTLPGRKSKLRLNDQIIPKPTDVNIGEKTIKVPTPKEHPYASHIPRFALFPSHVSLDGSPKTEQPFVNAAVPSSAPDVTLLSKTKGSAYRHELLQPRPKKAVTWAGEHGFLEYPKPHRGESQVFYPTPKTLMQPKPRENLANHTLLEQERTHWITSYQMHYSGSDKGSLKTDFVRKLIRNSHTAPQRDKPAPAFESSALEDSSRRTNDGSSNEELGSNQRDHSRDREAEREGNITRTKEDMQETSLEESLKNGKDVKTPLENMGRPNPGSVLSQRPVLPGIRPMSGHMSLRELQDAYSKTQAHHRFNRSITETPGDTRDSVCTGRRHHFHGVNAFYLHG